MNRLKEITAKAKKLYASGKFKKWTDAIKQASKSIGSVKKAAPKKKTATKKKAAPKKKVARNYGSHKDTKSHNVNIKVVSGITKENFNMQKTWQNVYAKLSVDLINTKEAKQKQKIRKELNVVKLILKDLKKYKGI